MIGKIYEILKSICTTQYCLRPSVFPSLTYSILSNAETYTSEGLREVLHDIQIDVWVKDATQLEDLTTQIKNKMWNNYFTGFFKYDMYERDVGIWHRVLKFKFLESEG